MAEHEPLDAAIEQLLDLRVIELEIVLVEVLGRGGLEHEAAAEQVADEGDLAVRDEDDDRAGGVTGSREHLALDAARCEVVAVGHDHVGDERLVVVGQEELEDVGERAGRVVRTVDAAPGAIDVAGAHDDLHAGEL